MTDSTRPVAIALLAFPESSASVVHGMYDVFMAVGRDWGAFTGGEPGPQLMQPIIVSAHEGAFVTDNGLQIVPQASLAECPATSLVCVPDLNVRPGEALEGRFAKRKSRGCANAMRRGRSWLPRAQARCCWLRQAFSMASNR